MPHTLKRHYGTSLLLKNGKIIYPKHQKRSKQIRSALLDLFNQSYIVYLLLYQFYNMINKSTKLLPLAINLT